MRIAHLLIAHKNPAQLARLLSAMQHEHFDFYIHLDQKVDTADFRHLARRDRVHFIKNRVSVNWAGYSMLKAIFNSMEEIIDSGIDYSFINLMSAQDYPIKSAQRIYEYLNAHEGACFMACSLPDKEAWWKAATARITTYHFVDYSFKGRYLVQRLMNRMLPARTFPLSAKLYGSSDASWWTMSLACARYVVDYVKTDKKLARFMKFTWGSDEFLLPTLVMNSPFSPQVINDNLRYIDWSEGNARPKTLDITDLDALMRSDKLIARKFDTDVDRAVLDKIDAHLTAKPV